MIIVDHLWTPIRPFSLIFPFISVQFVYCSLCGIPSHIEGANSSFRHIAQLECALRKWKMRLASQKFGVFRSIFEIAHRKMVRNKSWFNSAGTTVYCSCMFHVCARSLLPIKFMICHGMHQTRRKTKRTKLPAWSCCNDMQRGCNRGCHRFKRSSIRIRVIHSFRPNGQTYLLHYQGIYNGNENV